VTLKLAGTVVELKAVEVSKAVIPRNNNNKKKI